MDLEDRWSYAIKDLPLRDDWCCSCCSDDLRGKSSLTCRVRRGLAYCQKSSCLLWSLWHSSSSLSSSGSSWCILISQQAWKRSLRVLPKAPIPCEFRFCRLLNMCTCTRRCSRKLLSSVREYQSVVASRKWGSSWYCVHFHRKWTRPATSASAISSSSSSSKSKSKESSSIKVTEVWSDSCSSTSSSSSFSSKLVASVPTEEESVSSSECEWDNEDAAKVAKAEAVKECCWWQSQLSDRSEEASAAADRKRSIMVVKSLLICFCVCV